MVRSISLLLAVGATALGISVGCGSSTEPGDDEDSGSGGAASGGSSSSGGATSEGSGGSGSEVDPDPTLCGGAYKDPCAADKFCRFGTTCGTVGQCTRIPDGCDGNYEPVCGCDGTTYSNACEAYSLGLSAQSMGECSAPVEQIACGDFRCEPTDYCLDKGAAAAGTRFVCLTIPEECAGGPVCPCVSELASCLNGTSCSEVGGVVTLECE